MISSEDLLDSVDKKDMNTELFDGWPVERGGDIETLKWRHSDFKNVAYRYTHKLFEDMANRGLR